MIDPRERTSVHEAGHVVAAEALGVAVRDARVYISGPGGLTRFFGDVDPRRYVPILLAGSAAEELAFGAFDADGARNDRAKADYWASELYRPSDIDTLDEMVAIERRRVAALLAGRWTDLERVALRLLRRGELDHLGLAA